MKRSTVNTLVTLAVLTTVSLVVAKHLLPDSFKKSPEPAGRVLLPVPTKEAGEAALAKMRVEEDKVENYKSYRAKATPTNIRSRTGIYVSFIEFPAVAGTPTVRAALHVVYAGDDWIFFESLVSNCDGARFEFAFSPEHHIGGGGRAEEWATVAVSKRIYFEFLYDCATAKDSTIRLKGKFIYDHKLNPKEKQAILDTLAAFLAKGGTFNLPYD